MASDARHVRRQHKQNLEMLLRHALLTTDYCTAAGVAAALLSSQSESVHLLRISIGAAAYSQLVLVVWSCLELLRQHTAHHDQVKRTIRKVAALLATEPSLRQAGQLEAALSMLAAGEVQQAEDLLQHELSHSSSNSSSPFVYHLTLLQALIKHWAWWSHLVTGRGGSRGQPGERAVAAAAASSSKQQQQQQQQRVDLLGALRLPLQARRSRAGQSGLEADDAATEAEQQLRKVTKLAPAAMAPSLLLCQLLVVCGRPSAAAAAARATAAAAGRSAESVSLLALMLQPTIQAGPGAAGAAAAVRHEYVDCCLEVLQSDPWATAALAGLLRQCDHCWHCTAQAVKGLLCHLDAAAVEVACSSSSGGAAGDGGADPALLLPWSVLAALLVQLAAAAAAAAAASRAQQQQQQTAPGGAAQADAPLQLWQGLQASLMASQGWWESAGLTDPQELLPLQQLLQQQAPGAQPLTVQQQLVCCKAVVLGLALGKRSSYTCQVAWLLVGLPDGPDALAGGSPGIAARPAHHTPGSNGATAAAPTAADGATAAGALTASAAREAVLDALQLFEVLQDCQPVLPAQQQQPPKQLLGPPLPAFGAVLDLPQSWWAAFPKSLRAQRQQQQ